MDLARTAFLLAAGLTAGIFNGIAGGGSLITFPALLAAGLPPVAANVTNSVGVFPSMAAASVASRHDLRDLTTNYGRARLLSVVPTIIIGTIIGCTLLLVTPAEAFELIVPFLVLGAGAILAFRERIQRIVGHPATVSPARNLVMIHVFLLCITIYGGYFGAAMSILMIAGLAIAIDDTLARISSLKNILSSVCGVTTIVVFGVFGPVHWVDAAVLSLTTMTGGYAGAHLVRVLPGKVVRTIMVTFATSVGLYLLWNAFA